MPRKNIESQPSPQDDENIPEALPVIEEVDLAKKEGKYIDTSKEAGDWLKNNEDVLEFHKKEEAKTPEKLKSLHEEIEEKSVKEKPKSEEKNEDVAENTEEEPEEETIENRIQNANSLDELADILRPMKKGSGVQLYPKDPDGPRWNVGWLFGGKFGGEPVSSIISHIDEIKGTITHFSDKKLKYAYSDNHHVYANMDYIPEKGGLRNKVKELLEKQQRTDEEKLPKTGEEEMSPEELKSLHEREEKKTQEIVELMKSVSSLIAKVSEKYLDLKKWEFLLNYPDDEKDSFLEDFRPEIKRMVSQQLMQTEQENAALKNQLELTLKELEENGFGFIVDGARSSISVLEK